MNGFSFNVNTIGITNVCTAPWNLQHIKDLKMTEWSVETCSPIISSNKCCADVNNWLIVWYNITSRISHKGSTKINKYTTKHSEKEVESCSLEFSNNIYSQNHPDQLLVRYCGGPLFFVTTIFDHFHHYSAMGMGGQLSGHVDMINKLPRSVKLSDKIMALYKNNRQACFHCNIYN